MPGSLPGNTPAGLMSVSFNWELPGFGFCFLGPSQLGLLTSDLGISTLCAGPADACSPASSAAGAAFLPPCAPGSTKLVVGPRPTAQLGQRSPLCLAIASEGNWGPLQ